MVDMIKIIGRVMESTKVNGYIVQDINTAQFGYMQKYKVEELALNKQVLDCVAQTYNGEVTMKGVGFRLCQLPKYDRQGRQILKPDTKKSEQARAIPIYELKVRIINGKMNVGFIVEHIGTRERAVLTRDEVVNLANSGLIYNVKTQKAQKGTDAYILRGNNSCIEELPTISPAELQRSLAVR